MMFENSFYHRRGDCLEAASGSLYFISLSYYVSCCIFGNVNTWVSGDVYWGRLFGTA